MAETVLPFQASVERLEAGAEYHRPHMNLRLAFLHFQINRRRGTDRDTLAAAGAIVHINDVRGGYGPCRRLIDRLVPIQIPLVLVGPLHRADLGTQAAVVTQVHTHVARFVAHRHSQIPRLSLHTHYLGVGQDFDVVMQIAFDRGTVARPSGQHQAETTGVSGKRPIQQVHRATDARGAIQQVGLVPRLGQQQRRLHPTDASAHQQD